MPTFKIKFPNYGTYTLIERKSLEDVEKLCKLCYDKYKIEAAKGHKPDIKSFVDPFKYSKFNNKG